MTKKTFAKIYGLGAAAFTLWNLKPSTIKNIKEHNDDLSIAGKCIVYPLAYISAAATWPYGMVYEARRGYRKSKNK